MIDVNKYDQDDLPPLTATFELQSENHFFHAFDDFDAGTRPSKSYELGIDGKNQTNVPGTLRWGLNGLAYLPGPCDCPSSSTRMDLDGSHVKQAANYTYIVGMSSLRLPLHKILRSHAVNHFMAAQWAN